MTRCHFLQKALATIAAFAGLALSQASITSCPSQVRTVSGPSGASYAICASTDYRGPSDQVLQDVGTLQACVQMCDAQGGQCVRAVYDNENAICHFKSNQPGALTWVQDSQFSTIVKSASRAGAGQGAPPPANPATGTAGAALSQCPSGDKALNTITGAQFLICENTDFRGDSASVTGAASTESCAELCAQTATCTNAVFDKVNSECHVKGDPTTTSLTWVQDQQFDVIRLNMGGLGGGGGSGFAPPPATPPAFVPAPAPAPPKQDPGPDVDPALIGFLLGGLGAPRPPPAAPPQGPPPGFVGPPPAGPPPPGFPPPGPPPAGPPPAGFFGIPFAKRELSSDEHNKKSRGKMARNFVA
ncbi:hypothetical protein KVR01_010778 [Diaporthe batatas]|uniref:uncharacterized protein n=1 Tax=Diaporthe batatas TaxID=748121 RepID=UPI001D056C95|nr:uncharacterized protein KVR01_010778 [Diaporthe batatas]KAG8159117.1 hypothetical protein KVR01_010778 [Diaporthe batatas]